ncbi:MAG: SGNH/GDSL hydrolase family protein [Myxococcota bacterium]
MSALRNLALAAISVLLVLAAAEGALRVFAPIAYSMRVEYQPDPHVAFRLVPKKRYRLADGGTVTIDSRGYRGRGVTVPKPAGRFRIVVFGGSSTFSYLADDSQVWTVLLENRLREALGRDIEVVNVSAPGYSSWESSILYGYRVRDLEPDAVVVYHAWNDLKLFRGIDENGELRKAVYHPKPWSARLRKFQLAWRVRSLFRPPGELAPREERWVEVDPDDAFEVAPGGPAHRFARHTYHDMARAFADDGVLGIFVSQASLLTRENVSDPEVRQRVYTEFVDLDYPEILNQFDAIAEMQREVAEASGGVFVDVRGEVPADLEHFRDHVHLTDAGNEAVAEALAAELLANERFRGAVLGE